MYMTMQKSTSKTPISTPQNDTKIYWLCVLSTVV